MTVELCRHSRDPDRWFPQPTDTSGALDAKRVCWQCPAREACATHALTRPDLAGIWGALGEKDRREIRAGILTSSDVLTRDRQRATDADRRAAAHADLPHALTPCGTHTAYMRHKRNGQPIDDACDEAERAYQRNRKRHRRAA